MGRHSRPWGARMPPRTSCIVTLCRQLPAATEQLDPRRTQTQALRGRQAAAMVISTGNACEQLHAGLLIQHCEVHLARACHHDGSTSQTSAEDTYCQTHDQHRLKCVARLTNHVRC